MALPSGILGLWIVLLVASGYAAIRSWRTRWAIPAFLIFGTMYSSSDARWHECGHGTPFKTSWLNEVFYQISSFMTLREAVLWRWSHARHHTHTYVVGLDPEIQVMRPADLLKIALDFFYLRSGPPEVWRIVRHAFGKPTADVRSFVPASELKKMIWSSRVYVAIVGVFGVWALAKRSFLPLMFVALPRFYGGWLHQLLGLDPARRAQGKRLRSPPKYAHCLYQSGVSLSLHEHELSHRASFDAHGAVSCPPPPA